MVWFSNGWDYSGDPFEYQKHLNPKLFEVQISSGRSKALSYVLDQPFKYQTST